MDVDGQAPSGRQLHVGGHALAVSLSRHTWQGAPWRLEPSRKVPLASMEAGCPNPPSSRAFQADRCSHSLLRWPPRTQAPRAGMEVVSPWQDGLLADWELVEGLLSHAFK